MGGWVDHNLDVAACGLPAVIVEQTFGGKQTRQPFST